VPILSGWLQNSLGHLGKFFIFYLTIFGLVRIFWKHCILTFFQVFVAEFLQYFPYIFLILQTKLAIQTYKLSQFTIF